MGLCYHALILRWNLGCPQGESVGVKSIQLGADGSDMVDQAQLLEGVVLRCRDRIDIEVKGEDACQTPLLDSCLNLRRPHQVRRPIGPSLLDGDVVVRTSDFVLGAVLALREALVTSDVPFLASFATLARLGMATKRKSACHISQVNRVQRKQTFVGEDHRRDQPLLRDVDGWET